MSSRREFLMTAAAGTAALASGSFSTTALASGAPSAVTKKNPVPRWRGFYFGSNSSRPANSQTQSAVPALSREDAFHIIRDWGFDFVRITTNYWDWVDYTDKTEHGGPYAKDLFKIKESGLTPIDNTIDLARQAGLHVSMDMHRAPGYNFREAALFTINEPFSLWTDEVAQQAFVFYWDMLAKRYRGVGAQELSFDLVNEPQRYQAFTHGLTHESYTRVMTMAANKIRETSPDRIIFAEGLNRCVTSDEVVPELIPLKVPQSIHCYTPLELTHYRTWIDTKNDFPTPGWPTKLRGPDDTWGPVLAGSQEWHSKLRDASGYFGPTQMEELYKPFGDLIQQGIGVHCGEFGVSCHAPNDVTMRFYTDLLDILKGYGIGWTYLNLTGRGPGTTEWSALLDSGRTDVDYEDFHGHKLNRQLLTLLQTH